MYLQDTLLRGYYSSRYLNAYNSTVSTNNLFIDLEICNNFKFTIILFIVYVLHNGCNGMKPSQLYGFIILVYYSVKYKYYFMIIQITTY